MKIRKLLKTMVVMGILLIMCSVFFGGCDILDKPNYKNIQQYNATLYNPKSDWFNMHFLGNATSQTHLVSNQEKFDEIFKEFPDSINFDCQILLLYWESSQIGHPFELKDILLRDKTLTVKFGCDPSYHNTFGSHMTSLHQIFIVVVMNRIEFSDIHFVNTEK